MTTVKSFAHDAQHCVRQSTGRNIRRTHIFELIAAHFGHGSWAAMRAAHLVSDAGVGFAASPAPIDMLGRALQLGFRQSEAEAITSTLAAFATQRDLRQIRRDEVAMRLVKIQRGRDLPRDDRTIDSSEYEHASRRPLLRTSPLLVDSLERDAEAGAPVAYYLLACMFRCARPNGYLCEESQRGRLLNATEQVFVNEYLDLVPIHARYERYLRAAATAGIREAALELAEAFPSPQAKELAADLITINAPPVVLSVSPSANGRVARLRARCRRGDREALIELADSGDSEALRALAITGDHAALRVLTETALGELDDLQAWTWYHLALLHGIDLAKSELRAFHDGGSNNGEFYDSDFGGPLYVAGDEGIELPLADDETRNAALNAARALIADATVTAWPSRSRL